MNAHEIKRGDIESLGQLRDELKVQAALFKADVKTEWEKLETGWKTISRQVLPIKEAAKHSALDVESASKLLYETVKEGYERIKRTLH